MSGSCRKEVYLLREDNPRWNLPLSSCVIDSGPILGVRRVWDSTERHLSSGLRLYPVALKLPIQQDIQSSDVLRKKFMKEVAILIELRSPFIVAVYGICGSMLVMELMSLGSLYNLIETNQEVLRRWEIRVQIMVDAMRGLKYLHTRNIIHGDVKSPNILLTEEGSSFESKTFRLWSFSKSKSESGTQSGSKSESSVQTWRINLLLESHLFR